MFVTSRFEGDSFSRNRYEALFRESAFAASHARLFWEEIANVLSLPLYSLGLCAKWPRNVAAKIGCTLKFARQSDFKNALVVSRSLPGVFAVGDIRAEIVKRVASGRRRRIQRWNRAEHLDLLITNGVAM